MEDNVETQALDAIEMFTRDYSYDFRFMAALDIIYDAFLDRDIARMRRIFINASPDDMSLPEYFYFHLILNELEYIYG